jgi:hypothetical protein
MFAYGPHKRVELTLGATFGLEQHGNNEPHYFTGAASLLQVKFLLNEYKPNRWQGVAIATGSFFTHR